MKTRIAIVGILLCVIGVLVGRQARRAAAPAAKPAAAVRVVPGARVSGSAPATVQADEPAVPRLPESYAPRDPAEWQGMLVDVAMQAECIDSSTCGLAMACIDHRCGPCAEDSQCGAGEACVLDHCVQADQVACHSRTECGGESLCVLSGYSADPRGNAEMTAACLDPSSGTDQDYAAWVPPSTVPADPVPVPVDELLGTLPDDPT